MTIGRLVASAILFALFAVAQAHEGIDSGQIGGQRDGISSPASGGVSIALSATTIASGSANGTTLGTASLTGKFTGTATWAITDATGTFQINSSTGVVTVLSNTQLTAGNTIPITISETGTTPLPKNKTFVINVTGTGCAGQFILQYANSCALIGQGYGE